MIPCGPDAVGLELGQSILDVSGRVLLRSGVRLTSGHVRSLCAFGYAQILVRDDQDDDLVVSETIREETREIATMALHRVVSQVGHGDRLAVAELRHSVEHILADIAANRTLLVHLRSLRSLSESMLTHGVNVAVLSLVIARELYMDPVDMRSLGVGALLHDIGKVYYHRPGQTPEAGAGGGAQAVERHTIDGFELLRRQHAVDLRAAHVAYQHHERLDGSGFPRGLKGQAIHEWARMVAVADLYDNLTGDPTAGGSVEPKEAVARLVRMAGLGRLDARFVSLLANRLALYPLGSIIESESGQVGVVVGYERFGGGSVPRVRLVGDRDRASAGSGEVLMTGQSAERTIRRTLPDYPPRLPAADVGCAAGPGPSGAGAPRLPATEVLERR
jgi:putative nucleotidyltransferase with HDIG domain